MTDRIEHINEEVAVLIGQRRGRIWLGRMRCPNAGSPASVEFDWAWTLAREERYGDVIGFYHTHPAGLARPSGRDVRTMHAWVSCLGKPLLCVIASGARLTAYLFATDEDAAERMEAVQCFPRRALVAVGADVRPGEQNSGEDDVVQQPELQTDRLLLRPFTLADAPEVQRLAGEREIASTTLNIPHPYEDGMAEAWIGTHQETFERGEQATFAIVLREEGTLIGAIGLSIKPQHERAELGYWVGQPYWGQGYCTEAAGAVLDYGFTVLNLNRIQARHLARNPASGRVMQKVGMTYEGHLRQHVKKWGILEDIKMYGILRSEFRP